MSFQLGDVIASARRRSPAFHKTRITDAIFADFLSDFQNRLIWKAVGRQPHYLDQSVTIVLAVGQGAPGQTGAGSAGGLPGASGSTPGTFVAVEQTAGALVDAITDPTKGGTVNMQDTVVTSATATTVTASSASRTTNQDVTTPPSLIEVTAGTGFGQRAVITANTATQWTIANPWPVVIPDTTSMIRVVQPLITVANDVGVITGLPAYKQSTGYLVRRAANGSTFIDYTAPLVANIDVGVPVPSIIAITGGTVHYIDGETDPLTFTTFGRRFDPPAFPAVWLAGTTINLCGSQFDWVEVATLEIRYTPQAPPFQFLTDLFLLPDQARPACVAQAAAYAATVTAGEEGGPANAQQIMSAGQQIEDEYLSSLKLSKRARTTIIRHGFW